VRVVRGVARARTAVGGALLSVGALPDDVQLTTVPGFHDSAPVYALLPVLDWRALVARGWRPKVPRQRQDLPLQSGQDRLRAPPPRFPSASLSPLLPLSPSVRAQLLHRPFFYAIGADHLLEGYFFSTRGVYFRFHHKDKIATPHNHHFFFAAIIVLPQVVQNL
jgi:hypothetical protein